MVRAAALVFFFFFMMCFSLSEAFSLEQFHFFFFLRCEVVSVECSFINFSISGQEDDQLLVLIGL